MDTNLIFISKNDAMELWVFNKITLCQPLEMADMIIMTCFVYWWEIDETKCSVKLKKQQQQRVLCVEISEAI